MEDGNVSSAMDALDFGNVDQHHIGAFDGGKVLDTDKMRRIVPVLEGSVGGSSCGSQRSKLRLCVEMSIKSKLTGRDTPEDEEKYSNAEPVMVVVDYPDDVVVTVNAKIQRLEREILTPSDEVGEDEPDQVMKSWNDENNDKDALTDQNDNKIHILDSTFVKDKVPLSSTLIYPILEETESTSTSMIVHSGSVKLEAEEKETGTKEKEKSTRQSLSRDGSLYQGLYQTALGDSGGAEGFGNISAIATTDNENHERASEDQILSADIVNFSRNPSKKLNSGSMLFKSEKILPEEKLVKALHILARYRGVWGIYEHEMPIVAHLANLNRLLTTTDKATAYRTCRDEDYQELRGLISYFTLEKRFTIRSELLQTFTLLSQKSDALSSFISASDIPNVLISEVANGDYTSEETYAYASYLLQMLSVAQLTDHQCETLVPEFYGSLCGMIVNAQKKRFRAMTEILFEILLHYHDQLGDTNLKWLSLDLAATDVPVMKKIKNKLTGILLQNVSLLSPRSDEGSDRKIKETLVLINDFIICDATRSLFANAELDIMLVTLIHKLENANFTEFHREAFKTIYRILLEITTEPSGLDKLGRLVVNLLNEAGGAGDHDRCYRGVLKKIYKIVRIS